MNTSHNPVSWFEIYVRDMDRAKAFYEKTFGRTLEKLPTIGPEIWSFPGACDGLGVTGALCKMEGKDSGRGGTIIYFFCVDCGETAELALAAGDRSHLEKMSVGEPGYISLIYDTEENLIGLHSMQ